ncbi:hypothetical protein U14_01528 [Candidatus Moduliflexus flocculans]|uniref:Uncharacterized protein n=1 Tax=Candidatus Moduliflexus flocculans TaxID=1499966 RepID=A0A0S6VWU0_9BACT|nr:hypothetical protein U14_01528 [Candidatus Moduliflexus flocculans]
MLNDVIQLATDIYLDQMIGITDVEGFSPNALILFKRFKKAYENKSLSELADTISEKFSGSFYGATTKEHFLRAMKGLFNSMPLGINPHLVINIYNITSNTDEVFSGVFDFKAMIKVVFVPLPWKYDSGKVFFEAKPEGNLKYWRITSLNNQSR